MAQADTSNVTLVTGGSRGIGLEICVGLAKAGFKVYGTIRNLKEIKAAEERCKKENVIVKFIELDVTNDGSVAKGIAYIIDKEKCIDIVVNNAGITLPICSVEKTPLSDYRKVMEVNFFGVIRLMQEVIPHMRKQKNGLIINLSSCISLAGLPFMSGYTASKASIDRVSESASVELKPFGIRVVEISPGPVKTTFDEIMTDYQKKNTEYENYNNFMENVPNIMKTAITPQEVADCVVRTCKGEEKDFRVYPVERNKQFHGMFCKDPTYNNYQSFGNGLVTKKQ